MKDGHGGITVGSEISGGVKNLFAHDNDLDSPDLWTAIRVKNNASRGGVLENFYYRNNTVGQVSRGDRDRLQLRRRRERRFTL